MSKVPIKTNNDPHNYEAKIKLRIQSLPLEKDVIYVLDAFAGEGKLWKEVIKRSGRNIKILSIDKNSYKQKSLKGDNLKFLLSLPLEKYDIIDLDAWGSPSDQLKILKQKKYKGIVHCTFIQTMFGGINKDVLISYGYSEAMIKKTKTIFNKNGLDKILQYCSYLFDVNEFFIYSNKKKNYFYFVIQ